MQNSSRWAQAGLIYGPSFHYIDHLAPLCSLLQIPLLVTDEEIKEQILSFYPGVTVVQKEYIPMPEFLVSQFDVIFACSPRPLFDEIFFFSQKLHNKKVHTLWCPHGNSDKGHLTFFMEGLIHEESALVYGQKMIDFLMQKKAFSQLKSYAITGNYRKTYYLKEKNFYSNLVQNKILKKLRPSDKIGLYAPTWQDKENSSSFFEATSLLIEHLPENWSLIIKPHPNLFIGKNGEKARNLAEKYEMQENILFLIDFPPVYPLLDNVDFYIGDFSSISYDFLSFNKPMFFLNQMERDPKTDPGLFLYQCGIEILPDQYSSIYKTIQKEMEQDAALFSKIRREIDAYTFAFNIDEHTLKKNIEACFESFPDPELNFF